MEMVSAVVFSSKAISFMNPIDIIYQPCWNWCFSLKSSFTSLILFLTWISLKSRGVCMFVTLLLFLVVRTEHSRSFAMSFGVFALTLLIPQWITACLITAEALDFRLVIVSFRLCRPVYHNLRWPCRKMNSIPLYIWSVLKWATKW